MACDRYLNSIHESIDGTIGSIRRAELEMHLDQCEDCRALHDDLKRIHDAAAALPALDAPDRAWLQIAGRLRQEGRIQQEVKTPASGRRAYVGWLAAAAAVILAVAASVLLLKPGAGPAPQTAQSAPATAPAAAATDPRALESATTAVEAAQDQFEKAIADLEKVAKANQQVLDPATSTTIDKNLGILDQAIAENRAAVKTDPTSVAARETLFETLRQKVNLLQDTITLINEMRKGNNAAAAQLVNKS
jgi:anti-sigma factor RsiW